MPRYAETQKMLDRDVSGVSPDAAVKNIDMWLESMGEFDAKGSKTLVRDLEALKKALQKDKPNPGQILKIMARLGESTNKLAEEAPENVQEKLRGIGEALVQHGQSGGGEGAEDEDEAEEETATSGGRAKARA